MYRALRGYASAGQFLMSYGRILPVNTKYSNINIFHECEIKGKYCPNVFDLPDIHLITSAGVDGGTLTKHAPGDEDVKQSVSIASVVQSRPCDI